MGSSPRTGVRFSFCLACLLGCLLSNLACRPRSLPSSQSADRDEDVGPPGSGSGNGSQPPSVKDLKVKINEVMVSNAHSLADEDGFFPPWIELFNPTDSPVDLSSVPLSDDLGLSGKWVIPRSSAVVIAPRGYLVIFCDGDPRARGGLHASFELVPSSLMLVLNKGSDLFFFDASSLGTDVSAGRTPDGERTIRALASSTPGAANSGPAEPPDAAFVRGDANGDGRVNITDMAEILAVLFQSRPGTSCLDRMDADDNGKLDLADALRIGDSLYRHGAPLAQPFPTAGKDPTEDDLACPEDKS